MLDEDVSENDVGREMVENLDEMIAIFSELDKRLEKKEKFYLRCCVIAEK
jgi:hypothetical protein